jgi:hypothetical protein
MNAVPCVPKQRSKFIYLGIQTTLPIDEFNPTNEDKRVVNNYQ